jgi:hypothetical protein
MVAKQVPQIYTMVEFNFVEHGEISELRTWESRCQICNAKFQILTGRHPPRHFQRRCDLHTKQVGESKPFRFKIPDDDRWWNLDMETDFRG